MKKRTSALLAALLAAGLFGLSSQTVHAADDAVATPVAQTQTTEQAQTTSDQTAANSSQAATNHQTAANGQTTNQQPAKKPAITQQRYVGQVNYRYPYGVNLWQWNDDNSLTWTGRRLQARSKWQVYGYAEYTDAKTQKKSRLDNLGGNQWLFDEYVLNVAAPAQNAGQETAGNGENLPANSYAVITYKPNASVALFNQNGQGMKFAHRYLPNGSIWNVFKKQNVNNVSYYNLGGNQWINAAYAVLGSGKTAYTSLPKYHGQWYTSQYVPVKADYGCGPAALSMLMKYDDTWSKVPGNSEAAKISYAENYLPRGLWQGGQDSSAFSGKGFTRVISSKRLAQYGRELGDPNVRDISGASLSTIARLVSTGHPVLYYGWSSFNGNGQGAQPWPRNHCKVIFGYNPSTNRYLVYDPLYTSASAGPGSKWAGSNYGIHNGYDLGAISWHTWSSVNREYNYRGGANAITVF